MSQRPAPRADRLVVDLRRITGWDAVVAWLDDLRGRTRQRELEAQLRAAHREIERLQARLAEATRPPTQFARMRVRQVAVERLARLRLARGRAASAREETYVRR